MDKYYDIFIRDIKDWMYSVEQDISDCYGDADRINKLFQSSKKDSEYSKAAQRVVVFMANIARVFNDKLDDVRQLDIIYSTEVDRLKAELERVQAERDRATEQLRIIKLYDNTKIADNLVMLASKFNELIEQLNSQTVSSESVAINERIESLLSLFESNMQSVVVSEKMKQSPGRRFDNTKEYLIKSNYVAGIKPVELQRKLEQQGHKVSLPTIIKRYGIEGWVR